MKRDFKMAVPIVRFYWLGQVAAYFFPGTALVDQGFVKEMPPVQLIVSIVTRVGYLFVSFYNGKTNNVSTIC